MRKGKVRLENNRRKTERKNSGKKEHRRREVEIGLKRESSESSPESMPPTLKWTGALRQGH